MLYINIYKICQLIEKKRLRRKKPSTKTSGVSDSVKKYVKSVTKKTRPEMKYTI